MSEFYDPFNPFYPNFGGQEPDTDTPPGGTPPGLDPLGPPEVPPFPSDAELEDIQDAENRQELLQDIREGLVNPFDLTDEQLEFFTKGTISAEEARESLAPFYGVDVPGFPENASQAYKNRIAEIISSEGLTPAEAVARQNARLAEGSDLNDDGVVSAEEYEEFIAEPSLPDDGNDLPPGPSEETDTGEGDGFPFPFPDDSTEQPDQEEAEDNSPELPPPSDTPDDTGDDTVEEEFPELPTPDDDNEPPVEDEPGESELPPSGEIDLPPTDDETTDQSSESEEEAETTTEAEDQSDEPLTNQELPGQLPGGLPPGNQNPEEENDLPQLPPGDGDGDDDEESIMSRIGDFFKDIFTEGIGGAAAQALGQGGSATISNIIDVAAAAAIDRKAQEYYTDALRDASEAELEFLERMIGRQEVFRPFYRVGSEMVERVNPETGQVELVPQSFLGYQLNRLRQLVNRSPDFPDSMRITPEIDILPLIEDAAAIEAVDPTVNQINVADMLLGLDTGTIPEAMRTDVNLINPFNPEDPALRFLQDEGRRAIESAAAAEGRLNTGGTLQELQQQAIGTAAQYAGDLADIGRVQDQARLDADQQFYSQLLGSGREGFGREIDRLGAISDAQRFQDDQALQADIRRFESEADLAGTEFDMSRFANQDAIARDQTLINQLTGLVDIGRQGATGLTGNVGTFGTLGQSAYQQLGDNRAYEGLQRGNRFSNLLGGFLGT